MHLSDPWSHVGGGSWVLVPEGVAAPWRATYTVHSTVDLMPI